MTTQNYNWWTILSNQCLFKMNDEHYIRPFSLITQNVCLQDNLIKWTV